MTLVWKKDYETGYPIVDFQHRQLFKAFVAMMEICTSGTKDRVEGTLNFLVGFTDKHIKDSVAIRVLSQYQSPFQQKDGSFHERLASFVSELEQKLKQDGPSPALSEEIGYFVVEALANLFDRIHMDDGNRSRIETEISGNEDSITSDDIEAYDHRVIPPVRMLMPVGYHQSRH